MPYRSVTLPDIKFYENPFPAHARTYVSRIRVTWHHEPATNTSQYYLHVPTRNYATDGFLPLNRKARQHCADLHRGYFKTVHWLKSETNCTRFFGADSSSSSQHSLKHDISSPYSQQPVTCPYPKADESTSRPPILIPFGSILILFSHLRLGLPGGSFPPVSPPKPCIHLSSPHTCYIPYPSHSSRFYHPNNIGCG